jgi:hypothetical protein
MSITLSLQPTNVDGSANNLEYCVVGVTFSGNYPTGGDAVDFTTVGDKLASTQLVSAFAEGASSNNAANSQLAGFYVLQGNPQLTPGQSAPVPTPLNSWKLKVFVNTAGSTAELAAGAYPASVLNDNVQLILTMRKLL